MKLSVIVPIYNTGRYLRQCLDSLKQQKMQDAEFICVNDGSTDNSLDIIQEFIREDVRFSLINKENTGYGHSMNTGISHARGEYIAILESDDFAEPDMLEMLYAVAERQKPDIVKGNFNECDKYDVCHKNNNMDAVPYNKMLTVRKYPRIYQIHPSIWTALYRKSFLLENDIKFLETPGASFQDISFSFKVLHSAESIVCIEDAVMNYRTENYASSIFDPKKVFCVCDELDEMKCFLEDRYQKHRIDKAGYVDAKQCTDWLLYRNYMWNYERLTLPFKYAFLMIIKGAFKEMPQETFQSGMWSEPELGVVKAITQETDDYYKSTTVLPKADPRLDYFHILNYDMKFEQRAFLGYVSDAERISIYGAGKLGKQVYAFLKKRKLHGKVRNFVISDRTMSETEPETEGVPVVTVNELTKWELENSLFLVSVYEKTQLDILKNLDICGAANIILIDNVLREFIMQE